MLLKLSFLSHDNNCNSIQTILMLRKKTIVWMESLKHVGKLKTVSDPKSHGHVAQMDDRIFVYSFENDARTVKA
jgi:hypothetical protein